MKETKKILKRLERSVLLFAGLSILQFASIGIFVYCFLEGMETIKEVQEETFSVNSRIDNINDNIINVRSILEMCEEAQP